MTEIFNNIRQLYTFALPCNELSDHVEFYAESEPEKTMAHAGNDFFYVKMFASWTPTFYINLGQPYQIALDKKNYSISSEMDILILRDGMVERKNLPTDNIFTIKFYPGGLEAILGINQKKCMDKVVPLVQVLPLALLAKLKAPMHFAKRCAIIQDYLLENYKKRKQNDHYLSLVNKSIGTYTLHGMQLSTCQVAEKEFLTAKTINRYFHRVIGLSPKSYFNILRARTALSSYIADNKNFDPCHYGYYDHSHFSRDCFNFTEQKLRNIKL